MKNVYEELKEADPTAQGMFGGWSFVSPGCQNTVYQNHVNIYGSNRSGQYFDIFSNEQYDSSSDPNAWVNNAASMYPVANSWGDTGKEVWNNEGNYGGYLGTDGYPGALYPLVYQNQWFGKHFVYKFISWPGDDGSGHVDPKGNIYGKGYDLQGMATHHGPSAKNWWFENLVNYSINYYPVWPGGWGRMLGDW